MELIPVRSSLMRGSFNWRTQLKRMLNAISLSPKTGDIFIISGKFLAMSEGRYLKLEEVNYMQDAKKLSERYSMQPCLAEVVLREADRIVGGIQGFLLTVKDGAFSPNAGVDKSNIMKGYVILHPSDPSKFARMIRDWVFVEYSCRIGVVVTDSRLQPLRMGTVGIAIAASGLPAIIDDRGKKDLFGNVMRVTRRAIADNLASAAQLLMGETREAIPLVVARDSLIPVGEGYDGIEVSVPLSQDIYVRGLRLDGSSFP